jgi:hypothetical protein
MKNNDSAESNLYVKFNNGVDNYNCGVNNNTFYTTAIFNLNYKDLKVPNSKIIN